MAKILIRAGKVVQEAELNGTETAGKLLQSLPIQAKASTWGDEIYFSTPVTADEENAQPVVQMGELGYWPPGDAFCIFFGRTPASVGDEIRPASPVNIIGRLLGDPGEFKSVRSGEPVTIEMVE